MNTKCFWGIVGHDYRKIGFGAAICLSVVILSVWIRLVIDAVYPLLIERVNATNLFCFIEILIIGIFFIIWASGSPSEVKTNMRSMYYAIPMILLILGWIGAFFGEWVNPVHDGGAHWFTIFILFILFEIVNVLLTPFAIAIAACQGDKS